jgi:opacity protein-like surface antigen
LNKLTLLSALVFLSALSAYGQGRAGIATKPAPASGGVGSQQYFPRVEVVEAYSYLNLDTTGHPKSRHGFNGWESSATYNPGRWIGLEADVSGHNQSKSGAVTGLTSKQLSFLGGPRLAYRGRRATVFMHGLFGGDHVSSGFFGLTRAETESALAAGGGLDYAVTRQFSVRVAQVDYLLTLHARGLGGVHQNNLRVSAGVVIKLGQANR